LNVRFVESADHERKKLDGTDSVVGSGKHVEQVVQRRGSRLIPFQNLSYLRGLFDQAQKGT